MKSSAAELTSRGFLKESDFSEIKLTGKELLLQLNDLEPVKRTFAARKLGEQSIFEMSTVSALLERLKVEEKLYTRLEICRALAKGNQETATRMIPYITRIGNNQYQTISEAVTSKKKSYPLPRDIIARTLGNMDKKIVDVLFENLAQEKYAKEILDALGYLIFRTSELQTRDNFFKVKIYYDLYKNDLLFVWKFVIFCSAFPEEYIKESLEEIKHSYEEAIFHSEIERTLALSKTH